MKENLTDLTILVDRSGSMSFKRLDVENALDELINTQRVGEGDVQVTVTQFDSYGELSLETQFNAVPIKGVGKITIQPRGNTPLYDALSATIQRTGERLSALPEKDRPGKIVFIIVTDGGENSSRQTTAAQVAQAIKHQESKYSWLFMYVGCDQNALKEAQSFGLSADKALTFASNQEGCRGLTGSLESKIKTARGMSIQQYTNYVAGPIFDNDDRAVQVAAGAK